VAAATGAGAPTCRARIVGKTDHPVMTIERHVDCRTATIDSRPRRRRGVDRQSLAPGVHRAAASKPIPSLRGMTVTTSTSSPEATDVNVGDTERWLSAAGGGALILLGATRALTRGSLGGAALAVAGGLLVYRGVTGFCHLYDALGARRAPGRRSESPGHGTIVGNLGVKVDKRITVDAPPERLFALWCNFENLPRFMSHLERVTVTGANRSRWAVRAPAGMTVEWEAEIINERPGELIAWRSIGNPMVDSAGSVRFARTPDGRGTVVDVSLQYNPPGGAVGHAVAWLFGEDAGRQIEDDLERFKRGVETGQLAA
jgi:uncharacterized membrane protein